MSIGVNERTEKFLQIVFKQSALRANVVDEVLFPNLVVSIDLFYFIYLESSLKLPLAFQWFKGFTIAF